MNTLRFLELLQLCDSAFPSGAFAHSFGLETAVVEGRVHDETTFAVWLEDYLSCALGPCEASAIALAMTARCAYHDLDPLLFAVTSAAEARTALKRIGRSLRDAYTVVGLAGAAFRAYGEDVDAGRAQGHPALWTAAAMDALGVEPELAACAYLSSATAALASVASRIVPLGQRSTQRLLRGTRPVIARVAQEALGAQDLEGLGAWAIGPEIDALRHRLLDARVFSS